MEDQAMSELIKDFTSKVEVYNKQLFSVTESLEKNGDNSNSDIVGLLLAKSDADFAAYNAITNLLIAIHNRK